MTPEAQELAFDLMEKIRCYSEPEFVGNRMRWAAELCDLLMQPGAAYMINVTLEHLVTFVIPNEPDSRVIVELFQALERGVMNSAVDVDLEPLVEEWGYGKRDRVFLSWLLLMLARQGDERHLEFVRGQLDAEDEFVKKNARHAWDCRFADIEKRLSDR